jgi:hypothetical protein
MSTQMSGEMGKDGFQNYFNTMIPKNGAGIFTQKLGVGDASDFPLPGNLELYDSAQWEVLMNAEVFHDIITTMCLCMPDYICIHIQKNVVEFTSYCNSKADADMRCLHPTQSQVEEYKGYFNPSSLKEAAKKEIGTHVHLKWVNIPETKSSVFMLIYPLSALENGPTNSHLSFYLAEKIMDNE